MKPYPEYKPTGLAWLPQVPSGWGVLHIRELFEERKVKVSDKDFPPLTVSRGGIVPQMENVAKSEDGDNRKLVRVGDFVINSRSDRKSSSGVSPLDGSVSLINIVLTPRQELDRGYTHHLLKSNDFVEEYYRNGRGIVADLWTTRYSEMKAISLPVPPPAEQRAIVSYLDRETAKIDRLIQLKERMVELLQEKRGAIISSVVMGKVEIEKIGGGGGGGGSLRVSVPPCENSADREKCHTESRSHGEVCPPPTGSDAAASSRPPYQNPCNPCNPWLKFTTRARRPDELTDSGVDPVRRSRGEGGWLGPVPKGWKVCRFKYLVDICSNLVDPNQYLTMQQIAPECIEKNSGRLVEERKVCEAGVISWNHLFKKGQLIYSKIRPLLNKIVIAPYDGLCSADMYPLETTLNPKWLLVQMLSPFFLSQVKECCDRVKMPKINQEDLSKLFLLSPPEDEQRAIVAYLDAATAKIDAAVKAIEKSIGLLKERRVRLVSDAVTGRGRVSEVII